MVTELSKFGARAEDLACTFLKRSGYNVLDRNWRRPWGELDIVAERDRVIHFIEVKASRQQIGGFEPFLRADGRKMHKVQRTSQTWLTAHRYSSETEWQMDIISVILNSEQQPKIELFEQI